MEQRCGIWSAALVASLLLMAPGAIAQEIERKLFKNCPSEFKGSSDFDALALLNSKVNLLQGWSHAAAHPERYALQHPNVDYVIDDSRWQPQSDCRGAKTYQTILVKKMGDWSQNHVNGIEPIIDTKNIPFANIAAITLTLRVHSNNTQLPASEELQKIFSFAAEPDALKALDQGNVTLGLTLFGEHFSDQAIKTPNANFLLTIKPEQFDSWVTITLPVEQMRFYWEQNYAPAMALQADFAKEKVMGLRITPETDSGRVARNLKPAAWDTEREELYKEMAVEFREVVLLKHP